VKTKEIFERKCLHCNKDIQTTDKRKIYCSHECHWKYQNARRPTTQDVDRLCEGCGKPFKPQQVRGVGRRWCSVQCRKAVRKEKQAEYRVGPYQAVGGRRAYELKRFYGLSLDEYNAMLELQQWRCALCGECENAKGRRMLCVDHCHKKGHVRKLLCVKCNTGLGNFLDDPALLRKAADYLETHS
jgi:hypothetical protein